MLEVPSDMEAERRLVGALLISPDSIPAMIGRVHPEDFHFMPYRWVYEACVTLWGESRPVSPATVSRHLAGVLDAGEPRLTAMGGADSVAAILEGVDSGELDEWLERVIQARKKRDLFEATNQLRELAAEDDADAAITKAQELILGLTSPEHQAAESAFTHGLDVFRDKATKYLGDPDYVSGLATGWREFDRTLDGFQPGNLTMVYAPTSMFKSMFVQNMGYLFARAGRKGVWFTTEMAGYQVVERLVQFESQRNVRWLRRDGEYAGQHAHVLSAVERVSALRSSIYLCDKPEIDLGFLDATIMREKRNGAEYAIVDLTDMVTTQRFNGSQTANQSAMVRGVKQIARKAEIPIIGTTHIRKQERPKQGQGTAPTRLDLDEMKDTNTKATDSDCAISLMVVKWGEFGWYGLSREEIDHEKANGGVLTVMVAITKNRHGDTGDMPFVLNLNLGGRMFPMPGNYPSASMADVTPGATLVSQNVVESYQAGRGNT